MEADMNNDYQIITKNWRGIEIEIRWQNSYVEFEDGRHLGHLEIESMKPARAALPVTETGYCSHFIDAKSVINAGASSASRLVLNIWPPLSKHGSRMQVPPNAGTNAKHAKPQATNSRSFRAGPLRHAL
jgi:hypothetical protein